MSTKDHVEHALKRLEHEIAESVSAQDGPKKITSAVDALIDVKMEKAIKDAAQAFEKARVRDEEKMRKEDRQTSERYLALQTEEREIIKQDREEHNLADRIKQNNG